MGLLLLTLVAPALLLFGGDIYRGLESLATIWRDEFGFTRFWSTYGVFQVSDITVSGIFGHGEYLLGGLSAVFAALTWAGLLLGWKGSSRKDRKSAMKFSWFLLRVALLAWLFMLLLPAVDHSYSVLLLAADAILICAFLVDRESRPAVVRAIASASILLVLWGLFIWHSAWLP